MCYIKSMIRIILFVSAFFMTPHYLFAQASYPQPQPPGPPPPIMERQQKSVPLKKVSPGVFRLGDIEINKNTKSIVLPALINMDRGLLEYVLVRTGGKTHESLFRTQVQPYDLQVAFLLLGFEGTDSPLHHQGAQEKPKGEPVVITITYTKANGKSATITPEEWIVHSRENKAINVKKLDWVFTGSTVANGHFLAQMDGSIIAIYHDPVALIDNASEGGGMHNSWFVKEGSVPPVGTPVTLTIKGKK